MLFISTRFKFIAAAVPNETEELEVNPTRKQARADGKESLGFFCVDFEHSSCWRLTEPRSLARVNRKFTTKNIFFTFLVYIFFHFYFS